MRKFNWIGYSAVAIFSLSAVVGNSISNASAQEIPKAQCLSNYGMSACGYNCLANYGVVKCADWPGGNCIANYGEVVCGPPAPPGWLSGYVPNANNTNSGINGAWAVKLGNWNGILRMQGNSGRMILTSNGGASVEQRMTLNVNPQGGYILRGEVLAWYSRENYYADNFYIQQFSQGSTSARNCDANRNCSSVTLVYLGK